MNTIEYYNKNKFGKIVLFIFIAIIILLLLSQLKNKTIHNDFLNSEFSGKIKDIKLSQKGFPKVYIDDKEYYLNFYHSDLKSYIQIGDSIVKKRKSGDLYVYRRVRDSYQVRQFQSW